MTPSGATRLVGLLGWPVAQSKSPVFQNAAFAAAGLDWCYVPLATPPEHLPAAVRGLAAMGFAGANVTIPYKESVLGLLDAVDGEAALAGSVNTLVVEGARERPRLVGYTTDGPGFLASLREETGAEPSGMTVLVLGAGGAARSLAAAFARAGADRVLVGNRTVERARALVAALAGGAGRTRLSALPLEAAALAPHLGSVDLVVQATSIGMAGGPDPAARPPLDLDRLRPSAIVADLVYAPPRTPLLAAAEARGLPRLGGAGMLLHQGALAFERWTGRTAPLEVMRRALAGALGSPVGPMGREP